MQISRGIWRMSPVVLGPCRSLEGWAPEGLRLNGKGSRMFTFGRGAEFCFVKLSASWRGGGGGG